MRATLPLSPRLAARKRQELATNQTETRTRLAAAAERAKELEGVRLDTAAEARRLVADLQGRLATDEGGQYLQIVISASFSAQPPYERRGRPSRSTGEGTHPSRCRAHLKGRSALMAK